MERVQWSFCVTDHMTFVSLITWCLRGGRGTRTPKIHRGEKTSWGRRKLHWERLEVSPDLDWPKSGLQSLVLKCPPRVLTASPSQRSHSHGGNLVKPHHLARLSWLVAPSRGRRRRQFLGLMVSFLKYLTHLLVFWSRSWKESVAVPFPLTSIVQTAHDGLAAASSCWCLLSACCHCPGRILTGNFQVFKIANNFFAKLNFDWKECQGYLCTDEMSALKLWQHIWLWCCFDKARRPACTGAGTFCACVHCCQRRQRCSKPAWKACNSIRAGAVSYHLLGRFCNEMEQNVKPLRLPRSWLAR